MPKSIFRTVALILIAGLTTDPAFAVHRRSSSVPPTSARLRRTDLFREQALSPVGDVFGGRRAITGPSTARVDRQAAHAGALSAGIGLTVRSLLFRYPRVRVQLFGNLPSVINQNEMVQRGRTIREVLAGLTSRSPALGRTLYNAEGELRTAILINGRPIQSMNRSLKTNDELALLPKVAGGAANLLEELYSAHDPVIDEANEVFDRLLRARNRLASIGRDNTKASAAEMSELIDASDALLNWRKTHFNRQDRIEVRAEDAFGDVEVFPVLYLDFRNWGFDFPLYFPERESPTEGSLPDISREDDSDRELLMETVRQWVGTRDKDLANRLVKQIEDEMDRLYDYMFRLTLQYIDITPEQRKWLALIREVMVEAGYNLETLAEARYPGTMRFYFMRSHNHHFLFVSNSNPASVSLLINGQEVTTRTLSQAMSARKPGGSAHRMRRRYPDHFETSFGFSRRAHIHWRGRLLGSA